jgi:hypothetical protein
MLLKRKNKFLVSIFLLKKHDMSLFHCSSQKDRDKKKRDYISNK